MVKGTASLERTVKLWRQPGQPRVAKPLPATGGGDTTVRSAVRKLVQGFGQPTGAKHQTTSARTAWRFLQSDMAPDAHGCELRSRGDVGAGESLRSAVEELAVLVVQEHAQVLVNGGSRTACRSSTSRRPQGGGAHQAVRALVIGDACGTHTAIHRLDRG